MTIEPSLRDRIITSVGEGFAEQVAFTKTLVGFPSVRGAEHAVQDFVFRALRERNYAMDRFEMDRGAIERHPGGAVFSEDHSAAPIVVGIHRPRNETGRSLILQAHVDEAGQSEHRRLDVRFGGQHRRVGRRSQLLDLVVAARPLFLLRCDRGALSRQLGREPGELVLDRGFRRRSRWFRVVGVGLTGDAARDHRGDEAQPALPAQLHTS